MFFGDEPADFYTALDWGTIATMGAVWSPWTLAVSISTLRSAGTITTARPVKQDGYA
ncbi:hypothetical protein Asi02nite_57490 [Asanoa siamensis]|uniref:Uncharacterized protein n=1 Tax=Asanoa siamensis TaxID=926357 RepID=A0ABQ4CY47_9ACTN|nr:hypothetical protein Asi02nite_57490 [Asanoa siamensis]